MVDGSPQTFYEEGYVYVVPNNHLTGGVGFADEQRVLEPEVLGEEIIAGRIEINACATGVDNPVFTHEAGHVFCCYWSDSALPNCEDTIMLHTGNCILLPGDADVKKAELIYKISNNTRSWNNTLGTN